MQQRFPKKRALRPKTEVRSKLSWLPLTPEHGFPSLHISGAQGAPPRPGRKYCGTAYPPLSKKVIATKKQGTPLRAPLRKANKNFLRRHYPHQVKGSKAQPSSQPFAALPPWLPRVFFGFCRVHSCNLHTGKKHFRLSLQQHGSSKTLSNFSIHPMKQFARDL